MSKDLEPTTIGKLALGNSMADSEQWYVIPCPANVQLTSVLKERGTHGAIYALWECEKRTPCWIGQSIPALVRSINEKAVIAPEKRLHASSLYRCLRRVAPLSLFSRKQLRMLIAIKSGWLCPGQLCNDVSNRMIRLWRYQT